MSDTENKYEGIEVTSGQPTPTDPEPATEPREASVVVPYKPTEQPTDLDSLVDHLQRENAELKALVTDRDSFTEILRDAVHNAPVKPPIDPRTCSTEEYIANAAEIRKTLGIRTR